jgi:hypothetical protein
MLSSTVGTDATLRRVPALMPSQVVVAHVHVPPRTRTLVSVSGPSIANDAGVAPRVAVNLKSPRAYRPRPTRVAIAAASAFEATSSFA